MATFRQLILSASTQAQGAQLRTHLNNLNAGGGSGTSYNIEGMFIDIDTSDEVTLTLDVLGAEYYIEISTQEITVEVGDSPIYIDIDTNEVLIEEI